MALRRRAQHQHAPRPKASSSLRRAGREGGLPAATHVPDVYRCPFLGEITTPRTGGAPFSGGAPLRLPSHSATQGFPDRWSRAPTFGFVDVSYTRVDLNICAFSDSSPQPGTGFAQRAAWDRPTAQDRILGKGCTTARVRACYNGFPETLPAPNPSRERSAPRGWLALVATASRRRPGSQRLPRRSGMERRRLW